MKLALVTGSPGFADEDRYQAVSTDSQLLSRRWADERNFLQRTASDWTPVTHAALNDIRRTCAVVNWDDEGARAITPRTVAIAELAVAALHRMTAKGTPAPDILPEADGEICLSWSRGDGAVFSVSVGEHGNANFAGQLGREGGRHGWKPIATTSRGALEESLREIAEHVERLFRPAAGARRT
jgi:hypothetical protein